MNAEIDRKLLARVVKQDMSAMRLLYERHHDALVSFILSRGADIDTANDILHETMLEVWLNAVRFRATASVRTWIFTIARNKYVDEVRRSVRLVLVDEVPEAPNCDPSAEDVVDAAGNAARVLNCVKGLNDTQRAVIHMAFYEGLTYDEIASIEDVPVGTIKSRVFHAKQSMMRCLGGKYASRAG